MKPLLGAVAAVALMGAVPAWAQTSASDQTTKPVPQASMSDKADAQSGTTMGKARHHARRGRSPQDYMAEELNRQELERVQGNAGAGTSTPGTSGSSVPSSGAPKGYQPSNPSNRATGMERGKPSPGTMEEHPGASSEQ